LCAAPWQTWESPQVAQRVLVRTGNGRSESAQRDGFEDGQEGSR
jgi:hypothetical protein